MRAILAELRREIGEQCPDLAVRVTYAPVQHIDAFIEVYADPGANPQLVLPPDAGGALPPLCELAEARFFVDDAEVYTVAVLLHEFGRRRTPSTVSAPPRTRRTRQPADTDAPAGARANADLLVMALSLAARGTAPPTDTPCPTIRHRVLY